MENGENMNIEVRVTKDINEVNELEWDDLATKGGISMFSTYNWVKMWYEKFCSNREWIEPYLCLGYKKSSLIAIGAFAKLDVLGVTVLIPAGLSRSDYHEIIINDCYKNS